MASITFGSGLGWTMPRRERCRRSFSMASRRCFTCRSACRTFAMRVNGLNEEGRNAFAEYQVPQAVLALKQGFGRLIRAKTDRGVLSLLDNRIQRMAYGKIFMESLPKYATTNELNAVERFLGAGRVARSG